MIDEVKLREVLVKALETEVAKILDEEAKAAGKRVEERVRDLLGTVSVKLARSWQVERLGPSLVVKFEVPIRAQDEFSPCKCNVVGHNARIT